MSVDGSEDSTDMDADTRGKPAAREAQRQQARNAERQQARADEQSSFFDRFGTSLS